jgi:LemA protein
MSTGAIIAIVVVVVVVLLIAMVIGIYNGLVKLDERVNEAWSDITVQVSGGFDSEYS